MTVAVKYSIIIPVYKAEKTLSVLIPRLVHCMGSFTESFEVILVDDRSPDSSWNVMNTLGEKYPQLRLFRFAKNYGQLAATTCGFHHAKGNTIITMDDDLQFAPEDLPALIRYFESNEYVLVFGVPFTKYN